MTNKLKIGIDIDNVIADSYPAYLSEFNKQFGTVIKYEEVFDFYHLEKNAGVEEAKVSQFFETVLRSEEFQLSLPPFAEPQKIIQKWADLGFLIYYITSRPIYARKATKAWLVKHGFFPKNAKLYLLDTNIHSRDTVYKKDIVDQNGVNILIEDNKTITDVMDIPVLLLDKPWNKGKLAKNVKRVKDWEEIDQYVANSFR